MERKILCARAFSILLATAMVLSSLGFLAELASANGLGINNAGAPGPHNQVKFDTAADATPYIYSTDDPWVGPFTDWTANPLEGPLHPGDTDVQFPIEVRHNNDLAETLYNLTGTVTGVYTSLALGATGTTQRLYIGSGTPPATAYFEMTVGDSVENYAQIAAPNGWDTRTYVISALPSCPPGTYNMTVRFNYDYNLDSDAPEVTPRVAVQENEYFWFNVTNSWTHAGTRDPTTGWEGAGPQPIDVHALGTGIAQEVEIDLLYNQDIHDGGNDMVGNVQGTLTVANLKDMFGATVSITIVPTPYQVPYRVPADKTNEGDTEKLYFNISVPRGTRAGVYNGNFKVTYTKYTEDDTVNGHWQVDGNGDNVAMCTENIPVIFHLNDTYSWDLNWVSPRTFDVGSMANRIDFAITYRGNTELSMVEIGIYNTAIENVNVMGETVREWITGSTTFDWVTYGNTYNSTTGGNFLPFYVDILNNANRAVYVTQIGLKAWNNQSVPTQLGYLDFFNNTFNMMIEVPPELAISDRAGANVGDPEEVYMDGNDIDLVMMMMGNGVAPNNDNYWGRIYLENDGVAWPFTNTDPWETTPMWHTHDNDSAIPEPWLGFSRYNWAASGLAGYNVWNYDVGSGQHGYAATQFDWTAETEVYFQFDYWTHYNAGDNLWFEISFDGQSGWTTVWTQTGDSNGWKDADMDLSAWAGMSGWMRFRAQTVATSARQGAYVDNMRVNNGTHIAVNDVDWVYMSRLDNAAGRHIFFDDGAFNTSVLDMANLTNGEEFDLQVHFVGYDSGNGIDVEGYVPFTIEVFPTRFNFGDITPQPAPIGDGKIYPRLENGAFLPVNMVNPDLQLQEPRGEIRVELTNLRNWDGTPISGGYDATFVDSVNGGQFLDIGWSEQVNYTFELTQGMPAGLYTFDATISAVENAEDDAFFPVDMTGAWQPCWYQADVFNPYAYVDGTTYGANNNLPFTWTYPVDMIVNFFANLTVVSVTPTLVHNQSDDTDFVWTVENTGNVGLFDLNFNLTKIKTNPDAGQWEVNDSATNKEYNKPVDDRYKMNVPFLGAGETFQYQRTFNVSWMLDRGFWYGTWTWDANYLDDGSTTPGNLSIGFVATNSMPDSTDYWTLQTAEFERTTGWVIFDTSGNPYEQDNAIIKNPFHATSPIILFLDNGTGIIEIPTLAIETTNNEGADLKDVQAELRPLADYFGDGTPFDASSGVLPAEIQVADDESGAVMDIDAGTMIRLWFNSSAAARLFLSRGAVPGFYNITLVFTYIYDDNAGVVETNLMFPVMVWVKDGPDIDDPAMGSLYQFGLPNTTRFVDTLTNNIPYAMHDLQATIDYMGEELGEGHEPTGNMVEVFDPASNLVGEFDDNEADGEPAPGHTFMASMGTVDVIWTPRVSPNAQPGHYRVKMTLTGIINGTGQAFTREFWYVFWVNASRINVSHAKATDPDTPGVFFAGETFEQMTITITNDVANSLHWDHDNQEMMDVSVQVSGLPAGVNFVGTDTEYINSLAPGASANFEYYIDIARWVAPDVYHITVTVTYWNANTTESWTETFTVNFTVEYTPFIAVEMNPVTFDQGDIYLEFNVTFRNVGNVDLMNVWLQADIGHWFFGSGFFYVESYGPPGTYQFDIYDGYTLHADTWARNATKWVWFRLIIDEDIPYGDWRMQIAQSGYYWDSGSTGDWPSEYEEYQHAYGTGAPMIAAYPFSTDPPYSAYALPYTVTALYPFSGTYIPLICGFIPKFDVTVVSGPVFIGGNMYGTIYGAQRENVKVVLNLSHVETEVGRLSNIQFTLHTGSGLHTLFLADNTGILRPCEGILYPGEYLWFDFYVNLASGLRENTTYIIPYTITAWSDEDNRQIQITGCVVFDVKRPDVEVTRGSGSDSLELQNKLIDLTQYLDVSNKDAVHFKDGRLILRVDDGQPIIIAGQENVQQFLKRIDRLDRSTGSDPLSVAYNVDLLIDARPGTYFIPFELMLYSFLSEQIIWLNDTIEVRVLPRPAMVHISDMEIEDIIPGRDFELTFTITNDGGDYARDIWIDIWSRWYEDLEWWCQEYCWFNNFLKSISAHYYVDGQSVFQGTQNMSFWSDNNDQQLFSDGFMDMYWRNVSFEELGIEDGRDIVNISLDRERMLQSPQPYIDLLYISRMAPGESVELTYTFYADEIIVRHKPYRLAVTVMWRDSTDDNGLFLPDGGYKGEKDWEGFYPANTPQYSYTTNITVQVVRDVELAENFVAQYGGYMKASVALLVIMLLLILLAYALYFQKRGLKEGEGDEDFEDFDEDEEMFDEEMPPEEEELPPPEENQP